MHIAYSVFKFTICTDESCEQYNISKRTKNSSASSLDGKVLTGSETPFTINVTSYISTELYTAETVIA